jgi:hypothetical protein
MPNRDKQSESASTSTGRKLAKCRHPYSRPRLEYYGDIRKLTVGGSPGVGDSGSVMTRRPML